MTSAHKGGIVFRAGEDLWFLPASVAAEVLPVPEIARVPGAPPALVGVAVYAGEGIPVLAIGASRACLLVCSYLGERFGLVGVDVLATGRFSPPGEESVHGESVVHEGRRARLLDVAALVATLRG